MFWNMILIIIVCVFLIFLVYFIISGVRGFFCKKQDTIIEDTLHHFAILVPARNEEIVIGNLLDSLKKQNYPRDLYDIYVVVNNSQDHTEEIARNSGVNVIVCQNEIHSKGDVLQEAFNKLKDADGDTYVIFDADNVVDADFLLVMNHTFNAGYAIVQGKRMGKNSSQNIITGFYELFYMMQNVFFNEARSVNHRSASLNGTGWGIRKAWIAQHGFNVQTMTEDIELTILAALQGEVVGYAKQAVTYDEYPDSFRKIKNQLPRWMFGQIQCMRCYTTKLLHSIKGNMPGLDMLMFILLPFVGFSIMVLLYITAFKTEISHFTIWLDQYFWYVFLILYAIVICMELIGVMKYALDSHLHMQSILMFPLFLLSWVPVSAVMLLKRKCTWQQVIHDHAIRIEDIQ